MRSDHVRYRILWNFKNIKWHSKCLSFQRSAQQTDVGWAPTKWQAQRTQRGTDTVPALKGTVEQWSQNCLHLKVYSNPVLSLWTRYCGTPEKEPVKFAWRRQITEETAKCLRSFELKPTYILILALLHPSSRTLDELFKLSKLGFAAVKWGYDLLESQ